MDRNRKIIAALLGIIFGAFSYWLVTIFVTFGILYRYGIVGVISFPLYEEIIKFFFAFIIIISLKLEFNESLIVAFMIGVGFRIYEMELVSQPNFINFFLPMLIHCWGVILSTLGFYRYRETKNRKKLIYFAFSIFYHLIWNLLVTNQINTLFQFFKG